MPGAGSWGRFALLSATTPGSWGRGRARRRRCGPATVSCRRRLNAVKNRVDGTRSPVDAARRRGAVATTGSASVTVARIRPVEGHGVGLHGRGHARLIRRFERERRGRGFDAVDRDRRRRGREVERGRRYGRSIDEELRQASVTPCPRRCHVARRARRRRASADAAGRRPRDRHAHAQRSQPKLDLDAHALRVTHGRANVIDFRDAASNSTARTVTVTVT